MVIIQFLDYFFISKQDYFFIWSLQRNFTFRYNRNSGRTERVSLISCVNMPCYDATVHLDFVLFRCPWCIVYISLTPFIDRKLMWYISWFTKFSWMLFQWKIKLIMYVSFGYIRTTFHFFFVNFDTNFRIFMLKVSWNTLCLYSKIRLNKALKYTSSVQISLHLKLDILPNPKISYDLEIFNKSSSNYSDNMLFNK